jgi:hypothetical protein
MCGGKVLLCGDYNSISRFDRSIAEEVRELFLTILEALDYGYDREGNLDYIIQKHMKERMIATRRCAMRHFDNLKNRDLFILTKHVDIFTCGIGIKLNPKMADTEIDFLIAKVKMPELPQAQPSSIP